MRRTLLACALVTALALVAGASASLLAQPKGPPAVTTQFGYIKSLVEKGASYQLKLAPAYFLTGETANQAAIADGVIKPGQTIDNDYYIRKGRGILVYKVPASAAVTVLTQSPALRSTSVTVAQLVKILNGTSPLKSKLVDPGPKFFLGYWLRIKTDTVLSIDQQFQP